MVTVIHRHFVIHLQIKMENCVVILYLTESYENRLKLAYGYVLTRERLAQE